MVMPWKLKRLLLWLVFRLRATRNLRSKGGPDRKRILVCLGYQQLTGQTIAIAEILGHVAAFHEIVCAVDWTSPLVLRLPWSIRLIRDPAQALASCDCILADPAYPSETLPDSAPPLILTVHSFPTILHDLPQDVLVRRLARATVVHFVSETQRRSFVDAYPQLSLDQRSRVIWNFTERIGRRGDSAGAMMRLGVVGHHNRAVKDTRRAVELAAMSKAQSIECWGSTHIHGLDPGSVPEVCHLRGWSDDKQQIYGSFAVLISTSQSETFGLTVSEALSLGIPCVITDLPVFRELYEGLPGVHFLGDSQGDNVAAIDSFLESAAPRGPAIARAWEQRFGESALAARWHDLILETTESAASAEEDGQAGRPRHRPT